MEKKKGLNAKKLVIRTTLAVLTVAVCLALTGCGKRVARIEQNQLELQKSVQINTQQMTGNMKPIEDGQSKLHVSIEDVQDGTKRKAADIVAAIEQEQIALQNILLIYNQQLTKPIVGGQQNQQGLQSEMESLHINIQRADGCNHPR